MKLVSTAFGHQQKIPDKYTCKGVNVNPPLQFLEVPENAKSLVLIVDDPDAPAGLFVHWVVFNIDPQTLGIEEDRKPSHGTQGMTSFGNTHYGGPCPPSGTHRYFFKLYALDSLLELTESADKDDVEEEMYGHVIDQAELIGLYA